MGTKSKNNSALYWSLASIVIAAASLAYCFPHITDLAGSGIDRTSRTVAYFIRIIKGETI
ncbi:MULTISPECIES: hypothetical protein [Sporosarcina]|uniref:hypothetical protein n=1 Tax=Sporosarcina TaxID=1569 RepID=UPI00058C49ED|nr:MULTISPECIES: hypothetical protein [Sporosarcina]WJY26655.1 hypothetical protein QWT68_11275 [Sporosarcina sp. 0.2-SM1T-5]